MGVENVDMEALRMKTRLISAIIALPVFIIPIYVGGPLLYILLVTATCIGLFEFNKAFKVKDKSVYVIQLISAFSLYWMIWLGKDGFYFSAGVGLFIFLFISYVLQYPKLTLNHVFYGILGFYYIPVMLCHILLLRNYGNHGLTLVWLIFIISFGSDTFAYLVGRTIGKHKLSKDLSPNKTVEGAIGGIIGASLLSVIYAVFVGSRFMDLSLNHYIGIGIMGAFGAVFSQFGDISASAMKRVAGIKDFGKIMPGHGGLLDRIDSILFVGPIVYYIMLFIWTYI